MENGLTKNLPDLIELAIEDAGKLNREVYIPIYRSFHSYEPVPLVCEICLGGAIIAGTLKHDPKSDLLDNVFNVFYSQLRALDYVRNGRYKNAAEVLEYELSIEQVNALYELPSPVETRFTTWKEFDLHLESLKEITKQIREVLK